MVKEDKKITTSRVGRMTAMGKMGAGLARDVVGAAGKMALGVGVGAAAESFHRQAAKTLLNNLNQMRGLPMKAGQMISYIDDLLPPEFRHIYRDELEKLQAQARPMRWQEIRRVIEDDFGAPPEKLFAEFHEKPIAAASIGQVYKAKLHDGRSVAVKVQYPGIADAVRSDLKNIHLLKNALSLVMSKVDVEQSLADLSARVLEECDYGCEVCSQQEFVDLWEGDSHVRIPRPVPERCAENVLTTEFVEGLPWRRAIEASPEERRAWGEAIYRFVFRSLYKAGMFNADPHPGNYLFLPGGVVAFLDFGCVQRYHEDAIADLVNMRRMLAAGAEGETVVDAAIRAWGFPPDLDAEEREFFEEYLRAVYEPILEDRPFRFDRKYSARLADMNLKAGMLIARKSLTKGIRESKRPGFIFLNRIQFGLTSVLSGLEAEGNWRAVMAEIDRELDGVRAGSAKGA